MAERAFDRLRGGPEARRSALQARELVDESSLDLLYAALADVDPAVRREAVKLVGRSPATPALLLMLERALTDDTDLSRRSSAMEALAAIGKPALALLSRLSADPRVGVRRLAIDALGGSRLPDAIDVLDRSARDPEPAVRSAALEAIGRSGSPRAGGLLVRVVEERGEQPAVVLAALLGLIQLGKGTRPALPAALRRHSEDPLTAPAALRLLGRAGEVGLLVDVLLGHTGSRRRAAALGLAEAFEPGSGAADGRRPLTTRLAERAVREALEQLVHTGDAQVAAASILVAAHGGHVDLVAHATARDDRAHLASAAHRAVAILLEHQAGVAERLRMLAADDGPGADLLREIAEAAERHALRGTPLRDQGLAHALDNREFQRMLRLFETSAGLSLGEDARVRLTARLLPRVEEAGVGDFRAYLDLLTSGTERGREELDRALELATIHETYFFREPTQLDAFRTEVVPNLARRPRLRIWSAGSSTGEEAYTLAILLEELSVPYEIVGTDLSAEAIAMGRAGRYSPKSFRGAIEQGLRKRWFVYELGCARVHPLLKRHVRFVTMNLLDREAAARLGSFDVVFCRNVLIYLTPSARAQVIETFSQRLRPGGALLLGHSESLLHVETPFALWPLSRGLVYRKPGGSVERATSTNEGGGA